MSLRVRDQTKSTLTATSALAAVTIAGCVFMLMVAKPGTSPLWVIILCYTLLIGASLLPAAGVVVLARHAHRFGRGTLVLNSTPLQHGGPFVGQVEVTQRLKNVTGFRLTFAFVEVRLHSQRTSEKALWKEEIVIDAKEALFGGNETVVPVNFTIPDKPPPFKRFLGGSHSWKMTVEALPDVAPYFSAEFYLPLNAITKRDEPDP